MGVSRRRRNRKFGPRTTHIHTQQSVETQRALYYAGNQSCAFWFWPSLQLFQSLLSLSHEMSPIKIQYSSFQDNNEFLFYSIRLFDFYSLNQRLWIGKIIRVSTTHHLSLFISSPFVYFTISHPPRIHLSFNLSPWHRHRVNQIRRKSKKLGSTDYDAKMGRDLELSPKYSRVDFFVWKLWKIKCG